MTKKSTLECDGCGDFNDEEKLYKAPLVGDSWMTLMSSKVSNHLCARCSYRVVELIRAMRNGR